jgi:hypothetical protein
MSDTNFDYKKYLDNNPLLAEANTTPRKVTPIGNVAAGDTATRFDDEEFTVITTGTLADLEKYDVEKVTKDIDPDTEAIAVEDPNTGYAVYTYDLGGAVVFEEEPVAVKEDEGMDRTEALDKLRDMLEDLKYMSREANELLSSYFPTAHSRAKAYGALDFGTSSNRYDVTLENIIDGLERGVDVD